MRRPSVERRIISYKVNIHSPDVCPSGHSIGGLARMCPRIEAAVPFPRILVMRLTDAARDRAHPDIAEIDVPAVWALG
jgi:hypothetical protein